MVFFQLNVTGLLFQGFRTASPHWVSEGAVSLLVAVLSTVIVCSCGKDDIPSSLSTDTSLSQAK